MERAARWWLSRVRKSLRYLSPKRVGLIGPNVQPKIHSFESPNLKSRGNSFSLSNIRRQFRELSGRSWAHFASQKRHKSHTIVCVTQLVKPFLYQTRKIHREPTSDFSSNLKTKIVNGDSHQRSTTMVRAEERNWRKKPQKSEKIHVRKLVWLSWEWK